MAEPLLEARGLCVVRDGRTIVSDVALSLAAGDALAVLGPNGAGKSTLLKAIAGLLPHQGSLRLDGTSAHELDRRVRARTVAYVPQHSALTSPVRVHDVVAQGRFPHRPALGRPSATDRAAVDRALGLADVGHLAERAFTRLSYGERRRVLLARALATEARIVLLDEPTAALDVGHVLALFDVLAALRAQGRALIVVLHQLHEALALGGEALLLSGGRTVASGPVRDVLAPEHVRNVYGVELVTGGGFGYRLARGGHAP